MKLDLKLTLLSLLVLTLFQEVKGTESCSTFEGLGQVCAIFNQQDNCNVEVKATLNSNILFDKTVTLRELALPNTTFCTKLEGCDLCYDWDVNLDNHGSASGCVSLYGSCLTETESLGCFQEDSLALCASPCPNDCSGHGQCQYSGTCNCAQGYYSSDCSLSSNCQDRTETINRMYDSHEVQYYVEKGENWIGYITGYQPLSQISVTVSASQGNVNIWSSKSCYPIPGELYDFMLEDVGKTAQTLLINSDCSDINGGVWYILVQCSSASSSNQCSFTINSFKDKIILLTPGQPHLDSLWKLDAFYEFVVDSSFPALTIDVTTYANLDFVSVDILPGYCPTTHFAFARIATPSYFVNGVDGNPVAAKYILNLPSPQPGSWYVRIIPQVNNEFHVMGSEVELHYAIVASGGTCPDCQNGFCSAANTCTCEQYWTGIHCDNPLPRPSLSTYAADNSDEGYEDYGIWNNAFPIIGTIIIAVILIFIFVFIIYGIRMMIKSRSPPPDTLYDMLTHEQDFEEPM